jgi:hypothetical protein
MMDAAATMKGSGIGTVTDGSTSKQVVDACFKGFFHHH